MKKTYVCPFIKMNEAQAAQMMAESLNLNSETTVPGNSALTKENYAWDIWNELD